MLDNGLSFLLGKKHVFPEIIVINQCFRGTQGV